jgi:hypothetical protein
MVISSMHGAVPAEPVSSLGLGHVLCALVGWGSRRGRAASSEAPAPVDKSGTLGRRHGPDARDLIWRSRHLCFSD